MKKVIFTKTELHKFLLLGANGEYLINKIYPSVRAIKRKDTLSIFGTVRYNKNITTVKIGSFPKNSIDEIHAKFEIAKRVSLNGHNPNIILNSEVGKYKQIDEKSDKVTMEMVLKYYLNKRIISSKYKLNFFHNVKKNSNYLFSQNIKDFKKSNIELIIETLLKENKKATARNFLNNLLTIFNFALKNMNSKDDSVIKKNIKWFRQLKEIVSYKNKKNINLDKYKRITEKINSLNPRQIALIDKFIKTL